MSEVALSASSLPSELAIDSRRLFKICYLGSFTRSFGMLAQTGIVLYATDAWDLAQTSIHYFLAGTIFTFALTAILAPFAVQRIGNQRLLFLAVALQAASALFALSSPLVFTTTGGVPAFCWLVVGAYCFAAGSGLNEATSVSLVANYPAESRLLNLHQLYTAAPLAYVAGVVVQQLSGQSRLLEMALFLVLVAAYGIALLRFPALFPRETEDDRVPVTSNRWQILVAWFPPLFVMLVLMQSLSELGVDQRHQGLVLHMIGEIRGYDMVASYFAIVAFLKIVLHLTIGYLELIATYFELLFVGSLCSLIGLITLGNADSGPMLLRALLWSAAGAALLEPTLLAFLAGRYPRRNTTSLGVVIGASTLLALLFSAMLASLAPPITAAATLETYRQFTRYLLIAPGLMLAVYGALIAYYGEGHGYRLLARVRWPMNTTLSALLVWGFIGCFSAIVTTPPSTDLQGVVRSYLVTKTFDYVFGPFWSPFGWIAIPAIVLFSYIAIVILFKLSDHTELARSAFSLLFTLALFTIWVQPWLTLDGLIWNLITSYFKLSFFLVMDVLTTAGWYLSMRKVHQALDEL